MKKREMQAFSLVLLVMLIMTACGNDSSKTESSRTFSNVMEGKPISGNSDSSYDQTFNGSEANNNVSPNLEYFDKKVTITCSSENGYLLECVYYIGDWIKADDNLAIASAWCAIPYVEQGACPSVYSFQWNGWSKSYNPTGKKSAMAFIYCTIENVTDGFDIDLHDPVRIQPYIDSNGFNDIGLVIGIVGIYGTLRELRSGDTLGDPSISFEMVSNRTQIIFVLVASDLFTPNHPDGNPSFMDTEIEVGFMSQMYDFNSETVDLNYTW